MVLQRVYTLIYVEVTLSDNCYEFGSNHQGDVNFEHYVEPTLDYILSLMKNSESNRYGCLNLMKGNERSRKDSLASIEQLPQDHRQIFIRFMFFLLRKESTHH